MAQKPPRPAGITILAVSDILIGVVGLLGVLQYLLSPPLTTVPFSSTIGLVRPILGGVVLFFGLIWLLVGVGFLAGKGLGLDSGNDLQCSLFDWFCRFDRCGSEGRSFRGTDLGPDVILYGKAQGQSILWKRGLSIPPAYAPGPQYGQPPMPGNHQGFSQQPTTTNILSYSQPPASAPTLTFNPLRRDLHTSLPDRIQQFPVGRPGNS